LQPPLQTETVSPHCLPNLAFQSIEIFSGQEQRVIPRNDVGKIAGIPNGMTPVNCTTLFVALQGHE